MVKKNFEKLKNKYSVIYLVITLALSLLIGVSMMWTGLPVEYYQPREDDLVGTMQLNSSTVTHSATVDDSGNVVLDGMDCYFEINNITNSATNNAINNAINNATNNAINNITNSATSSATNNAINNATINAAKIHRQEGKDAERVYRDS